MFYVKGRKAASKVSKTATALSSKTGLDYVVRPIHSGISSGVGHVSNGVGHMSAVAGNMTSHVMSMPSGMRRRSSMRHTRFEAMDDKLTDSMLGESDFGSVYSNPTQPSSNSILYESGYAGIDNSVNDSVEPINVVQPYVSFPVVAEKIEPSQVYPEQNIDIQGPSNGKKLTDDLAEIKDKMHELTWHLFDDHTYVMKNPNTVFFGEAKGIDKRRKKRDPSKQMNKYLHTAQYSHSNPFVSRVGLYVEPIIGSTYSLLCLFRAGFNVVTWRDPILTFWLSFFCGIIAVVLFVFPWRIFLFVVGFWAVGPQNWAVRVLREQGHIPEVVKEDRKNANEETPRFDIVPVDKPIFTKESRAAGNEPIRAPSLAIDPREIHHVVVPYSPLVYQRCNDWPPEHEYSHVKRDPTYNSSQRNGVTNYNMLRNLSSVSDQPMDSNRLSKLRRRLRRSVASPLEPGTHNKFPERTRVDTA